MLDFSGTSKLTDMKTGATVALLDSPRLLRLHLSGHSPKQTSLSSDIAYIIRANWSTSERQRWKAHQKQLSLTQESGTTKASLEARVPPYTEEEKQWLKDTHKDECHFLQHYGFNIYNEKDRAEARHLVRAFMDIDDGDPQPQKALREQMESDSRNNQPNSGSEPQDEQPSDETDDDEDSENDSTFLRELEQVPESHYTDYHFSAKELKFIKKHYMYSSNFLSRHGLKFYDDDDCGEAKAILRRQMRGGAF